jgi:hypothetical protein
MSQSEAAATLARAALSFAAEGNWAEATLPRLAQAAGAPVQALHPLSLLDAPAAIEAHFDRAVADRPASLEESPRERLFDLCMRRFEAMEPHRRALAEIERVDPLQRPRLVALSGRSALWLLGVSGLAGQPLEHLRSGPLALILLRARDAWRKDAAGDFARTMVSLDRDLRRAEDAENRLEPLRRGFSFAQILRRDQGDAQSGAEAA